MAGVVTLVGQAKIADAIANGTDIALSRLILGDGNNLPIIPTETMTGLVHQVYDVQITSVTRDVDNPNWLICEGTVSEEIGPFTIREVGVKAADGTLFAVSDYPATEKYTSAQGTTTALTVRIIIVVSSTATATITLLPSDNVIAQRRIDTGDGLAGGGDLTSNRTHKIDWSTLASTSTIAVGDTFALRRASDGKHLQVTRGAILAGLEIPGGTITGVRNDGDGAGKFGKGVDATEIVLRSLKAGPGIDVSVSGDNVSVALKQIADELTV